LITINSIGNPKVTPHIKGSDFFIPKLKPEYEDKRLFGPGVNAATNMKSIKVIKCGYID
jgi:hypothetical protein